MPRPLKIAVFSDSAVPILNGVSVSIDVLIRELRERGHSVHLFTSYYHGHRDTDPNTHRFAAFRTPLARDYPLAVPPFYGMLMRFRQIGFDVIHTHTPFTVGFVGLRWSQSEGVPIVATYHTHYDKYTHYVPLLPKAYTRFKIAKHTNYYYNQVDHIITPSEASRRWLRKHTVHRPVSVIPTGVPPPKMIDRAEARQALGIPPEHRIMLYVGRIAHEKNIATLLNAAALLFPENRKLRLWLVGDGPARKDLTDMAISLGIGDRVRFIGAMPRSEVDQYYAASDLFAFASTTETQGLVVTEAMTYGLPAVVARGGGAGAAVEDGVNGRLIANRPDEMAVAVLSILQDDERLASYSREAIRASRQLTIPVMVDRVEEVYRGVLSSTHRGELVHAG